MENGRKKKKETGKVKRKEKWWKLVFLWTVKKYFFFFYKTYFISYFLFFSFIFPQTEHSLSREQMWDKLSISHGLLLLHVVPISTLKVKFDFTLPFSSVYYLLSISLLLIKGSFRRSTQLFLVSPLYSVSLESYKVGSLGERCAYSETPLIKSNRHSKRRKTISCFLAPCWMFFEQTENRVQSKN